MTPPLLRPNRVLELANRPRVVYARDVSREIAPRPQLSLVSKPQRLGLLPTWWFWNDWERQRLLLPLILLTAIPLGPLLFLVTAKLQLSFWLLEGLLVVVYPTLLLGLVERHIRRKLAMRAASEASPDQPPAISGPDHDRASSASRVGRRSRHGEPMLVCPNSIPDESDDGRRAIRRPRCRCGG